MLFFYTIILILGFATSYTDIKFRKIRNRHLLLATAFGLATYTYLIASHQMAFNINLIWNFFIGLGIGLLLYFTDTWGAGDAKLFTVFCLLMPTEKYSSIFFFPPLAIFANIFLLSTLAILILSAKQIIKDRKEILKKIFSWSTLSMLGWSFLAIFSLRWIIEAAINLLMPKAPFFLTIIFLLLLYRIIFRMIGTLKGNRILVFILGLGLVSRFFAFPLDLNIVSFFSDLKTTLIFTLIFYSLSVILGLNKPDDKAIKSIPFAPLMLIGTLLTNTNFINSIIQILNMIKK